MNITWAFLLVVSIWSTTPLAIQLSTLGSSFNFAVSSRMGLGLLICLAILIIKRQKLNTNPQAIANYLYAGIGVFITMSLVYFSAQSLPSGMIAVVFGLTPIVTGIFAYLLLGEDFYQAHKIFGLILGIVGLLIIFQHSLSYQAYMLYGFIALSVAMVFQAFVAVKLKQINAQTSALETTTGALIVALPLFLVSFILTDGTWPALISAKAAWAIVYLAIFGSVIGFVSYYYLIHHSSVKVVGIVPLITPVFALILGASFNNEMLSALQLSGIILVLLGLGIYEYGNKKLWIKK